jgi:hypothetical protein
MTKLVQPNVLRAYQSGEQYAINELVLYNSVPAYTNTALAQGVAGTAGNFTNIGGNTFSDSLFRIQDNDDATKQLAFQASGIATGQTKTITMPNADVNLGTMSSVATTDGNTLSGTRCRIVGGNNNNVSGTDNIVIGGSNNSLEGANNVSISSVNVGITYNAVYPSQKGIGNTFIGCVNYVGVFNVASVNSTYINYTFSSNAYFKNSLQPTSYSIVIGDSSGGGGCVVHSTLMSTNSLPLVSGSSNSSYPEIPACRVVGLHTITLHRVKLICTDGFTASVYGAVMEREVLVNSNSTILSITTIGTDTTWGGITITPAFTIVNDALRIICTKSGGASCFNRAYITSYY